MFFINTHQSCSILLVEEMLWITLAPNLMLLCHPFYSFVSFVFVKVSTMDAALSFSDLRFISQFASVNNIILFDSISYWIEISVRNKFLLHEKFLVIQMKHFKPEPCKVQHFSRENRRTISLSPLPERSQ